MNQQHVEVCRHDLEVTNILDVVLEAGPGSKTELFCVDLAGGRVHRDKKFPDRINQTFWYIENFRCSVREFEETIGTNTCVSITTWNELIYLKETRVIRSRIDREGSGNDIEEK